MVDQNKFQVVLLGPFYFVIHFLRLYDHTFGDVHLAGRLKLGKPPYLALTVFIELVFACLLVFDRLPDLHQALAAVGGSRHGGMVAEIRDLHTLIHDKLQQARAALVLKSFTVYKNFRHINLA